MVFLFLIQIPNTPNREPVTLIVGIAVDIALTTIEIPSPRIGATLRSRPPVTVRALIVERPISIPVPTWESC
jgi:hypothetical protein